MRHPRALFFDYHSFPSRTRSLFCRIIGVRSHLTFSHRMCTSFLQQAMCIAYRRNLIAGRSGPGPGTQGPGGSLLVLFNCIHSYPMRTPSLHGKHMKTPGEQLLRYGYGRRMNGIWKPEMSARALSCAPWPSALVMQWMFIP
jgi:hypothetical protein